MPANDKPAFADRLLAWFDEHGRKDLPWQHPRTPYRVWISEIMLQQTQVATVIPYFQRWVVSFPDIAALAAAPADDVLSHWSGLGYYARARNIHKTAMICANEHGGELPPTAESLRALPGIGPSTANAIVSQSADRPAAVLDGNVRRVLARHTATEGWTGNSSVQKMLWAEAESRLPASRGADYTQAVMDLGALVCTRARPACESCPVGTDCSALEQDIVDQLPTPKPAARIGEMDLFMLILRDGEGRVLLEKRPGAGIWGGLWSFPAGDTPEAAASQLGIEIARRSELDSLQHRLSHRLMTIRPLLAVPGPGMQVKCGPERGWFDSAQQQALGLPKPVSDLLARLNDGDIE